MRTITPDTGQEAALRAVYGEYFDLPVNQRHSPRLRWVMSPATLNIVSQFTTLDGQPLYLPPLRAGDPESLLGVPVELRDDAEGIRLEVGGDPPSEVDRIAKAMRQAKAHPGEVVTVDGDD